MAIAWITPKTDWARGNEFKPVDYNRIRNNILYLNEHAEIKCDMATMPVVSYDYGDWQPDELNAIEVNLDNINKAFNGGSTSIGVKNTFYRGGAFISTNELNRIESASQKIKEQMEIVAANKVHTPFTLGTYQDIRL